MFSRLAHKVTKGDIKPATPSQPTHVIVVGASTQVGQSIVQELQQGNQKQFFRVVAATLKNEKPEKIDRLRSLRCEMLEYSPDQMHSVEDFLKHHGIKAMILAGTSHDDTKEIKAWMDSGRRATVDYVLMLSTASADMGHHMFAKRYQDLEHYITNNARYYTILRSTLYVDVLRWYADEVRKDRTLMLPFNKDAYFAPVDTRDVAKAVAHILLDASVHDKQTYELTGNACKNGEGIARIMSKGLGTEIHYKEISMEEARSLLKAKGFSDDKIDGIISMYESINRREMMYVHPDFVRLTGERQRPLVDFVRDHKEEFAPAREE